MAVYPIVYIHKNKPVYFCPLHISQEQKKCPGETRRTKADSYFSRTNTKNTFSLPRLQQGTVIFEKR